MFCKLRKENGTMKKRIVINEKNSERITSEIKAAEGKATARTVTLKDIEKAIARAEKPFGNRIPKAKLDGTHIFYDGGEKFPNAYKYTPYSTHFELENVNGKWYLLDVCRAICPNRMSSGHIKYGDAAQAWIIEQAATI